MALESLSVPSKTIALHDDRSREPSRACVRVFADMRQAIDEVFPDDSPAWTWVSEIDGPQTLEPPLRKADQWLCKKYHRADPFVKRLTRRFFTMWSEWQRSGFTANGKKLYEHQKALFAWLTIAGICSGTRDELPAILLRSPYGTGKSLVAGMALQGFQDVVLELMLQDHAERAKIPRGAFMGLRKELLVQNALGEQYHALRPPYTVEDAQAREYHRQMTAMFGTRFTAMFPTPCGRNDSWYDLFGQDEESPPASERLGTYLAQQKTSEAALRISKEGRGMADVLLRLIQGEILILPDVRGNPVVREAPPRAIDLQRQGFKGDVAYALHPDIGIRATHRHLLPDPSRYTPFATPDNPALFALTTGTALTRDPERIRRDLHVEIMGNLMLMVIDEAMRYNPDVLTDSARRIGGHPPMVIALTGNDAGVAGWVRSPHMPLESTIKLRIIKPVGFQLIGTPDACYPAGSEGAWKQYASAMFRPVKAAQKLKLPQPWMRDGLIVTPTAVVREYADRIANAYREKGIEAEILCYDAAAGSDRWKILEYALRSPPTGRPRKVVASASLVSTGFSFPTIDVIDVLVNLRPDEVHQLFGRLMHRRNPGGSGEDRTLFRQQVFTNTKLVLLREIARQTGKPISDEDATWVPLQCALDLSAREADDRRKGMGDPEPVPDVRRCKTTPRTKPWAESPDPLWRPLRATCPMQRALEKKKNLCRDKTPSIQPRIAVPEFAGTCKQNGSLLTIRLPLEPSGMPSDTVLRELARTHDILEYVASLADTVYKRWHDGSRGRALADVVAAEIVRLQGVVERRRGESNGHRSVDDEG